MLLEARNLGTKKTHKSRNLNKCTPQKEQKKKSHNSNKCTTVEIIGRKFCYKKNS
jgi:hypothetical protein